MLYGEYIHPNIQDLLDLFSSNNLESSNTVYGGHGSVRGASIQLSASRLAFTSKTFLKHHLLSQTAYAHHVAPFLLTPK